MVSTGAGTVVGGAWPGVDGVVVALDEPGVVGTEGTGDPGDDAAVPWSFCDGVLAGPKLASGPSAKSAGARVVTGVVVLGVATAGAGGTVVVVVIALATVRAGRTPGVVAAPASPTVSC